MTPSIILITDNKREAEILQMFFSQRNIKLVFSQPTYANYIKSVQYKPAAVIIEMPAKYHNHLNYVRLMKKNHKTVKIPVIAYGDHSDQWIIKDFHLNGTRTYYQRPLKTGRLLQDVGKFLQNVGSYIQSTEREETQDRSKDLELLLDKTVSPVKKINVMVGYVKSMLAFPFTIAKVLNITQSQQTGAGDLAKAIQADPVITTTILKVANSVFFARGENPISTIRDAIVRIGFNETKNITMSISVMKLFTDKQKNLGFDRVEFWYHSLACAVIAEKIAKNAGYKNPNEAFISGLLHDFGILLLDEFFSELFEKVIEETTRNGSSFLEEENNVLRVNHNEITEKLFEKWKISENVIFAIRNQSCYSVMGDDTPSDKRLLATALGVAHIVTKAMQLGRECDLYTEPIPNKYFKDLKYPAGLREVFWEEIYSQMNMFVNFFKIEKRHFPCSANTIIDADKKTIAVINRVLTAFNPIDAYLVTQGYQVRKVKTASDVERLSPAADCIIIHANETDAEEDFNEFLEVINGKRKNVNPDNPEYLPVIAFYGYNSTLKKSSSNSKIQKYENTIDLRNVDKIIGETIA